MSLPSNYTKLDYIESHGTEYFDTGFKPNQDTRVVMDVENLATSTTPFFGARTTSSTYSYTFWQISSTSFRSDYCGSSANQQSVSVSSTLGRYTIDKNKNICTVQSTTVTNTAQTFSCAYNMYLLGLNEGGSSEGRYVTVKLYSCKIYDNGTLVRDFIPAMNASGTIGLWDDVNSTFYTNAGTGTFDYHVGKKHKTRIDGTGYEMKSGRVLIGGTGYDVKKGRTLIGGTGYDISFCTPVGELDVGTSVFVEIAGVRTEFLIANHGNPDSSVYTGGDGTWVIAKDIYSKVNGKGLDTNYQTSTMNVYANGDFFESLDSGVQNMLVTVSWVWNTVTYQGGTTKTYTVTTKVHVPRQEDLSGTSPNSTGTVPCLEYFYQSSAADRKAQYNGQDTAYWTSEHSRYFISPLYRPVYVETDGQFNDTGENGPENFTIGFRPILILPYEAKVDSDFNIIAP